MHSRHTTGNTEGELLLENMLDVGLTAGVKSLREQQILHDFTLIVEDEEFHVHKVVLASVSDFFRAMFTGGLMESKSDKVALKGLNTSTVTKLIDLIYTGREDIIKAHTEEILEAAVYLQMQTVTQLCTKELIDSLCIDNCFDLLSTFTTFSIDKGIDGVHRFMKSNLENITKHYTVDEIPVEVLQVVTEIWDKTEWDLFLFVNYWVMEDMDARGQYVDELMSKVRFALLSQTELATLIEMKIYSKCGVSWMGLVQKAEEYHNLPGHQKVLDESEQSRVRSKPTPVFFTGGYWDGPESFFELPENGTWKKHDRELNNTPDFTTDTPISMVVNNFLIICTDDKNWHILNPRTRVWSDMSNMAGNKEGFAVVHHGSHLYALGGRTNYRIESVTDEIEQYCFQTNTWSQAGKMPTAIAAPRALVYKNSIYVCGGHGSVKCSTRMDRLDLSSHKWESKADMLRTGAGHNMYIMTINNQDVFVSIGKDLHLELYYPSTDQWSKGDFTVVGQVTNIGWCYESMMLAEDNTIYIINVNETDPPEDGSDRGADTWSNTSDCIRSYICVKLIIPEEGKVIRQITLDDFPVTSPFDEPGAEPFSGMLAIPQHTCVKNKIVEMHFALL